MCDESWVILKHTHGVIKGFITFTNTFISSVLIFEGDGLKTIEAVLVNGQCGWTRVGNIWFLSPLVLSKWEDLAFSVCMLFEESVFIFQFLNNKMHNYVLFNTFVHFIIQKLKNKHTFLKTEKAKFSRRENLVFILFEEIVFFSIF